MTDLQFRVMVLETHPFQRALAVNALQRLGCIQVLQASTGSEALAALESIRLDVVICDLEMEDMDGLEFIQHAAASGKLGAVLLSSCMPSDIRHSVIRIGELLGVQILGDIAKPFNAAAMHTVLKRYVPKVSEEPVARRDLLEVTAEQLRRALVDQQIVPFYQPKFDLLTGEILGVEVLARWDHPFKGVIPPSMFLPAVEGFDLMDDMLFSLMDQALGLQRMAATQGIELKLAFNLHASQLVHSNLSHKIKKILSSRSASGSSVTFELTESGLIDVPAASLENLVRLRMMGCALSIDDFGAGYSSLQRLCQLPFNEIKLDAEFVRELGANPRCKAVVASTLALGSALGMSVVIEGVEREQMRQELLEIGCSQGQGYWHSRPMAASDLLHKLTATPPAHWRQS
ncbi:Regulator of RpoS [Pseudomonas fluorescens]|uniref:EAL domain-containing response regulator n=1 Tax=Pseudomonas fluorescens TaxID=294 RepID=UPI0012408F04|nr:EAL domain-containing response regulator [Pseudomonas fluorescens]VVP33438.1 Regulator of RpoS [Pseudomonas fluorescens]